MNDHEIIRQLSLECGQINSRLRDCHAKIALGFYENAVELAERVPALLAEVTRVNSKVSLLRAEGDPEFDDTLACDLGVHIDEAYLSALQEAYDRVNQLKPLAQLLRQLVLSRAPAPSRLSVMREMLALDPSHPFLDEDIRKLERAWYSQVLEYCRRLAVSAKKERVAEVIEDLRSSGYVEPISHVVVAGIKESLIRAKLVALEKEILAAYHAQQTETLEIKFGELDQIVAETGLNDPSLEKRFSEARTWLATRQAQARLEQDQANALSTLQALLQNPRTLRNDLLNALQWAESLGAVDESLRARVDASLQVDSSQSSKPMWMSLAVACLALAAAGPMLYWFVIRKARSDKQQPTSMQTLTQDAPAITPVETQAENTVESNVESKAKAPAYTPSEASPEPKQLRPQQPVEESLRGKESRIEDEFAKCNTECSTTESQLQSGATTVQAAETVLTKLESQKNKLVEEIKVEGISSTMLAQSETDLNRRLASLRSTIQCSIRVDRLLQAVRKDGVRGGSLQELFSLHESLAEKKRSQPLPPEVKQAYLTIDQLSIPPAQRQSRLNVNAEQFQQLPTLLQSALRAATEELTRRDLRKNYRAEYLRIINRPELQPNIWIARFPEVDETNQNHNYFVADHKPAAGEKLPILGGYEDAFPAMPKTEARLAPQVEFRARASKLMESSTSPYALFDDLYADLLGEGKAKQIDPIFRLALVSSLTKTMESMSLTAKKHYSTPEFKQLDVVVQSLAQELASRSWAQDQAYSEFALKRKKCEEVLNSLPRDLNLKQLASATDEALARLAENPFHIVGIYTRSGSPNCVVTQSQARLNMYSKLVVINPDDASSTLEVKAGDNNPQCDMLPVIGIFNK